MPGPHTPDSRVRWTTNDRSGIYPKSGFRVVEVLWRSGFKPSWIKLFLHYFANFLASIWWFFKVDTETIIKNAKNFAKKEEKPCTTCLKPIFCSFPRYPKNRFWVYPIRHYLGTTNLELELQMRHENFISMASIRLRDIMVFVFIFKPQEIWWGIKWIERYMYYLLMCATRWTTFLLAT